MAPQLRSSHSKIFYQPLPAPTRASRRTAAPRNASRPAGEGKAKSSKKSKKGKGPANLPRTGYVDHGTSPIASPAKSGRSTPQKTPPPGGISKTSAGSRQRTPPSSLQDPSLVKRNGRRVGNNLQVIPERVAEGRVTKRFPPVQRPRTKGLWNKGNLCYRNATLQALFHVPAFYRYLGKMHKNCRNQFRGCVVCSLQLLAQAYYNMPNSIVASASGRVPGPYKPLEIFNSACFNNPPTDQALPDMIEEFRHESQSDAWTFAQWLLMLLQDKELPSDDVSFSHMFEITSEERWTCEDCGETSILQLSEEIGMPRDGTGLSLGIAAGPSTTLVECLENKFESTWRRRCYSEHCSKWNVKEYDGPKRHITRKLTKTPEVLVLQVKRFDWGPRGPKKLFNKVQVEEYLNLGPFTKDRDDVMYRLDGVVAHKGGSISSGHYIAAVRNAEGTGFVRANDDTQVGTSTGGRGSVLEMQNPRSWHSDFQPYVLTYSKV